MEAENLEAPRADQSRLGRLAVELVGEQVLVLLLSLFCIFVVFAFCVCRWKVWRPISGGRTTLALLRLVKKYASYVFGGVRSETANTSDGEKLASCIGNLDVRGKERVKNSFGAALR